MKKYENIIFRISVVFVILGLILIYISGQFYTPKNVFLKDISSADIGKSILTTGKIVSLRYNNNNLFLTIEENNTRIPVIKFDIYENIFQKNQNISVFGEVNLYNGQLEIIANKLDIIY